MTRARMNFLNKLINIEQNILLYKKRPLVLNQPLRLILVPKAGLEPAQAYAH